MEDLNFDQELNRLLKRNKQTAESIIKENKLGTFLGSQIDIDGLGPRPLSSFVFLQQWVNPYQGEGSSSKREWEDVEYKSGDRVLLIPLGTSYAVVGRVI